MNLIVSAQEVTQFAVYIPNSPFNVIVYNVEIEGVYLILEIRGKKHHIFLIHSVRCTINCVLEKL